MLSIVIPALNAGAYLPATFAPLSGTDAEILLVDGGSSDATPDIARALGARVLVSPRGRGIQLLAGTTAAIGDWLLLLHADTVLAAGWADAVRAFTAGAADCAAYFRFALDSDAPQARRLERAVAWRCRRLALPYGDQGLLVSRALLERVGGVRPLPLMEDVDLVRRIVRAVGRRNLVQFDIAALTSAARWERDGWLLRSARNLSCLSLFFCGVPPSLIRKLYA